MGNEDYDAEILREKGYIVELSNQGELKKHNPNFYNPNKETVECMSPDCEKKTKSVFCMCSKHKKLVDYPFHAKDWVGRVVLPNKTREECKTWALPHGKIARLLVKWIGDDSEKAKKIDNFVDDIIEKIHEKMPDATTFQKIYLGEINEEMSPDKFVDLTKKLVDKHFPEKEFLRIDIDGRDMKFKGMDFGLIPLRVVLASLVLALGCEESNRGDAYGVSKVGLQPRYANIFMPLGSYLLMRKGATDSETRMSLK